MVFLAEGGIPVNEKYSRRFRRVGIGAAILWVSALLADILLPILSDVFTDASPTPGGHGGGGILFATPICIAAVLIAWIVCRIKSKKDSDDHEHTE